jgi:enoyl-CoA hydratase/carnithine racemase
MSVAEGTGPRVRSERDGELVIVTLDLPPHNYLRFADYAELARIWLDLDGEEELRAVVLRAAPGSRSFSTGSDVNELRGMRFDRVRRESAHLRDCLRTMRAMRLPIVLALGGLAAGSACSLAAACDLRVASPAGAISLPEIRFGGVGGGSWLLPELPAQVVRRLVLTGEEIGAQRLYELGWVGEVVADELLLDRACALARSVCAWHERSVALGKRSLRLLEAASLSAEDGFELETGIVSAAVLDEQGITSEWIEDVVRKGRR